MEYMMREESDDENKQFFERLLKNVNTVMLPAKLQEKGDKFRELRKAVGENQRELSKKKKLGKLYGIVTRVKNGELINRFIEKEVFAWLPREYRVILLYGLGRKKDLDRLNKLKKLENMPVIRRYKQRTGYIFKAVKAISRKMYKVKSAEEKDYIFYVLRGQMSFKELSKRVDDLKNEKGKCETAIHFWEK
jgi:hypothetical protein